MAIHGNVRLEDDAGYLGALPMSLVPISCILGLLLDGNRTLTLQAFLIKAWIFLANGETQAAAQRVLKVITIGVYRKKESLQVERGSFRIAPR